MPEDDGILYPFLDILLHDNIAILIALHGSSVRLAEKNDIRTVAYIPPEGAKGFHLLPVFACREIIADKFAQLGEVVASSALRTTEDLTAIDEQGVIKKIVSFARPLRTILCWGGL